MDAWQFLKWLYWGFERANQRWTYLDLEPSLGSRMMLLLTILQNKQIPAVNINNRLFEVRFNSQRINLILCYRAMNNQVGCVFLVVIRSELRMGQYRDDHREGASHFYAMLFETWWYSFGTFPTRIEMVSNGSPRSDSFNSWSSELNGGNLPSGFSQILISCVLLSCKIKLSVLSNWGP